MCVDLYCAHGQGSSSSSGVGKGAGVTIGVAVLAGATYNVLVATWPIFLALEIVGLCIAYWNSSVIRGVRFAAGAVLAAVMWVTRWAYRRWGKRSKEVVAIERAYQATLFVEGEPGENHLIVGRGTVTGPWATPFEAADAVRALWVATQGLPVEGPLKCHAVPVAS